MIDQVITLVDAAKVMYPHERGRSAYDRVYRYVTRNERACPVRFVFLRSDRCGRRVRCLNPQDIPALKRFVEGRTN